jgi:hypothetical protein
VLASANGVGRAPVRGFFDPEAGGIGLAFEEVELLGGFFVTLAIGLLLSTLAGCFFAFNLEFFEELPSELSDEESDDVELDDATSVLVSVKDFLETGTSSECEEDSDDSSLESLSSEGGSGVLAAVFRLLFWFLVAPSDSDEVEDDPLSDSTSDAELDVVSLESSDSGKDSVNFEARLSTEIFVFFALGFSSSESESEDEFEDEFEDEDEELDLALRLVPASFEDGIKGLFSSSSSASLSELVEEDDKSSSLVLSSSLLELAFKLEPTP